MSTIATTLIATGVDLAIGVALLLLLRWYGKRP